MTYEATMTHMEEAVLQIIKAGDYFEDTPTECFEEIFLEFDWSKNVLKGVLGSLVKKELIFLGEYPNGTTAFHLQY
ncbi:hypothetical protein OAB94_01810 [Flavobacteriaceae bacterium]|nr:hypothetical protein [Flavobacteriaceae bacterium]MDB9980473.1 hypothetical protein [bacterium]